jgi:osmotically-inducible protein OsmY
MQSVCTMFDTAIAPLTRRGPETFPCGAAETLSLEIAADPVAKSAADLAMDEVVKRALRATGYLALRDIQVELDRGIVVLWGRVPTYHQKQLAQAVAQKVSGVRGIANGIEVVCSR